MSFVFSIALGDGHVITTFRFAAALVLGLTATADAQTVHEFSAASSVAMWARNTRYLPFVVLDGENRHARLATITTDVRTRTDAEGVAPESTVAFTVDDLSKSEPKRLSSFSDPGSTGEVVGDRYSAVTMPACCDGADVHGVRALNTGRLLFRSTGPGATGTAAWAEAPNAKPPTVRWAAYDGVTEGGLLGRIVYGGDEGPLSAVGLRSKSRDDHLDLALSHSAVLIWVDPSKKSSGNATSSGEPGAPRPIWTIEGVSDPGRLSGFQLALVLNGRRLLTIPITRDRLVASEAKTSGGIAVTAVEPR